MSHRTVDEYAAHVRALITPTLPTGIDTVTVRAALGRVTAAAIPSPVDLPLFRNSQGQAVDYSASRLVFLGNRSAVVDPGRHGVVAHPHIQGGVLYPYLRHKIYFTSVLAELAPCYSEPT